MYVTVTTHKLSFLALKGIFLYHFEGEGGVFVQSKYWFLGISKLNFLKKARFALYLKYPLLINIFYLRSSRMVYNRYLHLFSSIKGDLCSGDVYKGEGGVYKGEGGVLWWKMSKIDDFHETPP